MDTAGTAPGTHRGPSRPVHGPLMVAMVVGTALRLLLVLTGSGTERFSFSDSESYLIVADLLPRGLWAPPADLATTTLWRTPIYPMFIALTGGSGHPTLVIVVQCLVGGALNVWLAHRLARSVFGASAAIVAAFACALDPVSLAHSLLFATETLSATWVLLLALGARATMRRVQEQQPAWLAAVGTGMAGALLALTRPNLLLLAPAAAMLVALVTRRGRGLAAATVILAASFVPIAGWVARNQHVGGTAVLTTVTGQNLVDYGLAAAANEEGILPTWVTDHDAVEEASSATAAAQRVSPPLGGSTETAATNERWTREGADILRDHPRGAMVIAATTATKAAAAPGTGLIESHLPRGLRSVVSTPLAVMGSLFLLALYGAAAAGVASLVRDRRWADVGLLLGAVALALLCSVGPWLYVRFRVPVLPLVAVLSGGGVDLIRRRLTDG